jgi:hypothetical protein
MTVIDELLRNNEEYASSFDKGICRYLRLSTWPWLRAWTPV